MGSHPPQGSEHLPADDPLCFLKLLTFWVKGNKDFFPPPVFLFFPFFSAVFILLDVGGRHVLAPLSFF